MDLEPRMGVEGRRAMVWTATRYAQISQRTYTVWSSRWRDGRIFWVERLDDVAAYLPHDEPEVQLEYITW